jgi:hypothetical protein
MKKTVAIIACGIWLVAVPCALYGQEEAKPSDIVQLKATIVRLQAQVLEQARENATLRGQVAELQLAALRAAIATMDPAVRKELGLDKPEQKPVTPQTPPK